MKFICNTRELSDALNTVGKAISNKANIPILEGIKIRAEGDEVTLAAADLELYISTRVKANVKLEGETVVTGKIFAEFMRKVADEEVDIEKYTSTLSVSYGVNVSEFQCMDDETYPESKDVPTDNGFVAKDKDLRDTIEGVIFCAAQDDSRPILRGCKLEVEDDELVAAALPFPFPAAVAALLIMLALFIAGVLKPQSVKEVAEYLLANMAFLFVPSGVAIMEEYAAVQGSVVQLLAICVITLVITFGVTAWTVTGVIRLMERRKGEERA